MRFALVIGFFAVGGFLQAADTPGWPQGIQDLGHLGSFLMGAAAMGAVVVWAVKALRNHRQQRHSPPGGSVIGSESAAEAERRTTAAVKEILADLRITRHDQRDAVAKAHADIVVNIRALTEKIDLLLRRWDK